MLFVDGYIRYTKVFIFMLLFLFLCLDLRFSPHYYVSDRDLNDCSGFLKDLRRGRLKCKLISVVYTKKKFFFWYSADLILSNYVQRKF